MAPPEYRRVTRQCAKDDFSSCKVHDDVFAKHGSKNLLKQFLSQDPATWYVKDALRERRRDVKGGQVSPGTRPIGSLKVSGFRAWVWLDDGSVYDVTKSFSGAEVHWMIAHGNRRKGHRSDLQEKRVALLQDPEDGWRPTTDDYADLLADHDDGFTERVLASVQDAMERAADEHNTVIVIEDAEVQGAVVHEHDEDEPVEDDVKGVVVHEIDEVWLMLDKTRTGGRPLEYLDALTIAALSFPDGVEPEVIEAAYDIRDGLYAADPETHHVFYAHLLESD
jgi:hypothetical protein